MVRPGMPLVDGYLGFLEDRCRPNTVLAAAYDLRVFLSVVGNIHSHRAARQRARRRRPSDRATTRH